MHICHHKDINILQIFFAIPISQYFFIVHFMGIIKHASVWIHVWEYKCLCVWRNHCKVHRARILRGLTGKIIKKRLLMEAIRLQNLENSALSNLEKIRYCIRLLIKVVEEYLNPKQLNKLLTSFKMYIGECTFLE